MNIKTALITGGSRGIGKKTAIALAENGYNIIINYRSSEKEADDLAKELTIRYNVQTLTVQGDISIKEDCENLIRQSVSRFGGIDIVIHNAGPYIKKRKKMDEYSWNEWLYIMNGNLNSVFYLTKLVLPYMRQQGWGRIITFGFDRVETAPAWIYRSSFAAAKTGLASLTRTIAIEEAENGITANMVCPGDIVGAWKEAGIAEAMHSSSSPAPVGRNGTGEDVARVVSFLVSDLSGFITGSIIPVTGAQDVLGKIFHAKKQTGQE
ncbi:SDR family oxidoreductase [Bacillus xiapuensis]|uniref:SDR family oxidoreductase n=1 Tax=Bacillus xiapuensis TaxID=2014075 RepID=UPI000C24D373|nr:SDR family oxidoreductase [Bacillus xiapuensis]